MKRLSIPTQRGSVIPFTSWMGLGTSIKQLYGQPLHYLTNILLKQWDHLRIGSEDEDTPLDIVIHPCKAEANVWLVEELHRQTTSHHHLAKLWQSDPMHHAFIDSIFPQLWNACNGERVHKFSIPSACFNTSTRLWTQSRIGWKLVSYIFFFISSSAKVVILLM